MSYVDVVENVKEKEKETGHLVDEFHLREVGDLKQVPEENKKARGGRTEKILATACIIFLYAISIASIVLGALHMAGWFGNSPYLT